MLLPGQGAARIRRQAAELLCRRDEGPVGWRGLSPQGCGIVGLRPPRWLGGDISLINEVCRARGFQEELAVRAPEHPARVFGEAVEAGPCESLIGRMLPSLLEKFTETLTEALTEKLTLRIDERFAAFEQQHRARGGPYALPNADPRPLTIAQFLKERSDTVPKNFAPAFGTLVAVPGIPIAPPIPSSRKGACGRCRAPRGFQAAGGQAAGPRSREARPLHGAGPAHHGALLESCASISTRPRRPRQHF